MSELNESAPVLQVDCIEDDETITRSVRPTRLTVDHLQFLWNNLKRFDVLFNDFVKGDFRAFVEHFIYQDAKGGLHPTGLMWNVDDVGLFFMNEIKPMESAEGHFVFWDQRFNGREELCREMLKYVFEKFLFQRISVKVPLYAKQALNAVERIGLVHEGRLRRAAFYKEQWFDVNIYSAIPDDFRPLVFKSGWAARFVCPSCGKTLQKKNRHGGGGD